MALGRNKKAIILVNLILGQSMLFMIMVFYQFLGTIKYPLQQMVSPVTFSVVLLVAGVILGISTIYLFNEIINLTQIEKEALVAEENLKSSQQMIHVLKANQHDFMNHLQVLYTAAQVGTIEVVQDYFHGIVKQVREVSSISGLAFPEIAALIYSKVTKAEESDIKVTVNIQSTLQDIAIKNVDLARVLGNLLDNAIYALNEIDKEKRELTIKFHEEDEVIKIAIHNRWPIIPKEIHGKIFEEGYTTKGDKGSGIGLNNVRNILSRYYGGIELISEESIGTTFIVYIPKKAANIN